MNSPVNFPRQSNLFPAQLELVANPCQEAVHREGEVIFEEKRSNILTQGEIGIRVRSAGELPAYGPENEAVITELRRGRSFGEIALGDEGSRFASARAVQKDTAAGLCASRAKLIMLWETYPQLGHRRRQDLSADPVMKICNADLRIFDPSPYKAQGIQIIKKSLDRNS